jgi:predicted nucleic acid-binding protein
MKVPHVYADTSVFGGCFDREFERESLQFSDEVKNGRFVLVVSDVTTDELLLAPDRVRGVLADVPVDRIEIVHTSPQSEALQRAYLRSGIVGPASSRDAAHIAVATVANVDMVVSWNFKHIVHYDKISWYGGVNTLNGYRTPKSYSPREVIEV